MHTKSILRIALPILAANISVPLLGLVDTAILGHLDQAYFLSAAALGAQFIGLLFWSFGFLRMGTTGFAARSLGEQDKPALVTTLYQSLLLALIIALSLLATHWIWLNPGLGLILSGIDAQTANLALEYSQIRVWGAPATLMTYVVIGWLIGIGNAKATLSIMLATNILNIVLDYILIVSLGLNTQGAALASLSAEYFGLVIALYLAGVNMKGVAGSEAPSKRRMALDWPRLKAMITSSRQLFIRTLCLLGCLTWFTRQGVALGDAIGAANAILLNMLILSAFAMDGFAHASETLCGQAWGKQDRQTFVEICIKTTLFSFGVALISSLVMVLAQQPILAIYTDLPAVITAAGDIYLYLALLPLIAIWCYQLDGILIGVGQTGAMQNGMLISTVLVYAPLCWLLAEWGNTGLWLAFWGFHIARSLTLIPPFLHSIKQLNADRLPG